MNDEFEKWARWNIGQPSFAGKYVSGGVWSYDHMFIDKTWQCWQAASQHYEEKLAKATKIITEAKEDVINTLNEYENHPEWRGREKGIEFCKKQLAEIDEFLEVKNGMD